MEFNSLSKENLLVIVDIMLEEINDSMAEHGIEINIDTAAKEKLDYLRKNYPEFTWGVQKTN